MRECFLFVVERLLVGFDVIKRGLDSIENSLVWCDINAVDTGLRVGSSQLVDFIGLGKAATANQLEERSVFERV